MKQSRQLCVLVVLLPFAATSLAFAASPTWAKRATTFPSECDPGSKGPYENGDLRTAFSLPTAPCNPVRIPSPDGKSSIEVRYRKLGTRMSAYLRVTTPGKHTREAALPYGFQDIDLLWSPDSKAFFVNGGNGGGYWGFWVYLYLTHDPKLTARAFTRQARADMVRSFPPCKATNLDHKECKSIEADPESYNMTGIDWASNSTIVVMAEVPCSGSYGGIMCQIMGYELDVPSGRILKRLDAKSLKLRWQKSMAWSFEIPPPPEYK